MQFQQNDIFILFYLQKYGFLTLRQIQKLLTEQPQHKETIARRLRILERCGYIKHFGYVRVAWGRAPKVFYLTENGFEVLIENKIPENLLGRYKKRNKPQWSPVFRHRIELVDLFISLELSAKRFPNLEVERIFLEYNRNAKNQSETADFIADKQHLEDKLIPDGAFILKNSQTQTASLYFMELDRSTETIISQIAPNSAGASLQDRMRKYEQYLLSRNFAKKYAQWGAFEVFTLLFVTTSERRIDNIRAIPDLNPECNEYFYFNTYENSTADFFCRSWKKRDSNLETFAIL